MPSHEADPRYPSERLIIVEQQFAAISRKLDEIKEQTSRTNGRVNELESWRDKMLGILLLWPLVAAVLGGWAINKLTATPQAPMQRTQIVEDKKGNRIAVCNLTAEGLANCTPIQSTDK